MRASTPARRAADAQETNAHWERTGVRCGHPALLRLVLAPIIPVSATAWCAKPLTRRKPKRTGREPECGAGIRRC